MSTRCPPTEHDWRLRGLGRMQGRNVIGQRESCAKCGARRTVLIPRERMGRATSGLAESGKR